MEDQLDLACSLIADRFFLSDSERAIVKLLSEGFTPAEIADSRSRSIATVRTQIKHTMSKMGVARSHSIILEVFKTAAELSYNPSTLY